MSNGLRTEPLTPDRFADLERLFAGRRVVAGCWCMFWRQTGRENRERWGAPNRDALHERVATAVSAPGLIAYLDDEPAGWVAVAPLPEFGRILRSPTLRPPSGTDGVWSVNCFYVAPDARGRGLVRHLLDAAVEHARSNGAVAVQGYPIDVTPATCTPRSLHGDVDHLHRCRVRRGGPPFRSSAGRGARSPTVTTDPEREITWVAATP